MQVISPSLPADASGTELFTVTITLSFELQELKGSVTVSV